MLDVIEPRANFVVCGAEGAAWKKVGIDDDTDVGLATSGLHCSHLLSTPAARHSDWSAT